jgi:hypothetical protein
MVNAFSFCLYGPSNPRYYPMLIENIRIIKQYFPDWKVYVYAAPDVDTRFIEVLKTWDNVVLRFTGELGAINMIHRFYAIDEPDVDLMMVRDADSLVHWKDRWAIRRFVESPQYVGHAIRDNEMHNVRMLGGLWGMRKSAGFSVSAAYQEFKSNPKDYGAGYDQSFLTHNVYPKFRNILVHHSFGLVLDNEVGEPFPFAWTNDIYCGRIEYVAPVPPALSFNALTAFKARV